MSQATGHIVSTSTLHSVPPLPQVVEEKPVLICEVEYIKDEEDDTADTEEVKFSVGLPSCSFLH